MDSKYFPLFIEVLDLVESNLRTREVAINRVNEITKKHYWFPSVFRALTTMSIEEYAMARAISESAMVLLDTDLTVTDIAKEYNFLSQQTYSAMFAQVLGMPPHIFKVEKPMDKLVPPYKLDMQIFEERDTKKVYIEELPDMKVGSLHLYKSNSKQSKIKVTQDVLKSKVWSRLLKWHMLNAYAVINGSTGEKLPSIAKLGTYMVSKGLHTAPFTRYFGFPKPVTGDSQEVSYEGWVMIHDKSGMPVIEDKDVNVKMFKGGLYAVIDVPEGMEEDLTPYWTTIHRWIQENPEYTYDENQYFEEYLTIKGKGNFHGMRLHMPIKKIK